MEEICERSTKLITLIDLCGHTKYLKTTIFGLTGYSPDFAMLVVSANSGMGMFKFFLYLHEIFWPDYDKYLQLGCDVNQYL